ncbi:MAG TPA: RidA family protein [Anaerolinea thermolimosa]|uniref:RidA family protein n=1 Tax=Anaerolinea thermolimosa TaxID=229919 RepID=A0A3D1JIE1_9CHLR|nr:RidA family protein [Anaerolinea thermolimosa]GAP06951.1 endoribonuclease L-PSP [Anaerolinea thermolimosa]HCE17538.1 RidA family protein [Anaerolinea thermolimosa]
MACCCEEKRIYTSEKAPKAQGPYSPAVKGGGLVFIAGQLGMDPATGNLVEGGIEAETRQALTNLKHLVEAAGSSMDQVVKVTVFLRDIQDFQKMNSVYAEFFVANPPARSAFQVGALPRGAAVEIEAIALASSTCDCGCSCG